MVLPRLGFLISFLTSMAIRGRPGVLLRDFHVQNSLKPLRCHPITVLGLTTINTSFQSFQNRERITQNIRSRILILGLLIDCFITANCCRKARFSSRSCLFNLNSRNIKNIDIIIVIMMLCIVFAPTYFVNNISGYEYLGGTPPYTLNVPTISFSWSAS